MSNRSIKKRVKPSRRINRKNRKSNRKGGSCGCENSVLKKLFNGGSAPTPGFSQLAGQNYYPLNTENNNPNYTSVAGRLTENVLVRGGGRKSKRHNLRVKKIRGGSSGTPIGMAIDYLNGAVSSTVVGASSFGGDTSILPYSRYTVDNTPKA